MDPERDGDNQYEFTLFGPPSKWINSELMGVWRQQCDEDDILERPRDITVQYDGVDWDGEETLPHHII